MPTAPPSGITADLCPSEKVLGEARQARITHQRNIVILATKGGLRLGPSR
jgi:aryl-alcohol dehydrogenase-like predicted oxidoreductase